MGVLREIVFDCAHPASLARFWAGLLDGFEIRPYDDEEIARLASVGLTPETDTNVMVDGPGLHLSFQQTSTPTAVKNKVHLDVMSDDRDALVTHISEQGATVAQVFDTHTWMRDPEGNDFCITDAR
jgi:hypothetical protein